jgi:uncharacterized protein (UPF0218 family)
LSRFYKPKKIHATIGDISTANCFNQGIYPRIVVYDNVTKLHEHLQTQVPHFYRTIQISFRGIYDKHIVKLLHEISNSNEHVALLVSGEEDSLEYGIIAEAPLNSTVVAGGRTIKVTEKIKAEARRKMKFHKCWFGTSLWQKYGRQYVRK